MRVKIPDGLSMSLDFRRKSKTTLRKDPVAGFGAKFVGPEDIVDESLVMKKNKKIIIIIPTGI